jgi:CheY-like chemotaxis protein
MPDRNHDGYVLIVDDDEDIGETISLILGTRGYRTSVARDGAEALQLMQTQPLPEVVLLDMMMPGMNGEDFRAAQLKDARIADVPVVLMTGDGRAQEKAARLGVSRFLRKPIAINDLIEVIAAARKHDAP